MCVNIHICISKNKNNDYVYRVAFSDRMLIYN